MGKFPGRHAAEKDLDEVGLIAVLLLPVQEQLDDVSPGLLGRGAGAGKEGPEGASGRGRLSVRRRPAGRPPILRPAAWKPEKPPMPGAGRGRRMLADKAGQMHGRYIHFYSPQYREVGKSPWE